MREASPPCEIRNFKKQGREQRQRQCEKYSFSFTFFVLYHRYILPFDFAQDSRIGKAKMLSLEGKPDNKYYFLDDEKVFFKGKRF